MFEEKQSNAPASSGNKKENRIKFISDQFTLWIGIIGSVVTITLTIWNTHTKSQIDEREEQLKSLELRLKERSTGVEESKERVERYKWVLSLFTDLSGKDEKKRNFTIGLIRLALTNDEAEKMFAGLQSSSDRELQLVGQNGFSAIQNEPIALLVSQMNANRSDVRKSAVAALEREYRTSSQAITMVLRTYDQEKIGNLSPSGAINGLYFLGATDPNTWDQQQVETGKEIALRIEARGPGDQTKAALNSFKSLLQKASNRS